MDEAQSHQRFIIVWDNLEITRILTLVRIPAADVLKVVDLTC
jgi:hypothetical protein